MNYRREHTNEDKKEKRKNRRKIKKICYTGYSQEGFNTNNEHIQRKFTKKCNIRNSR
jgi:hypothetical protein